MNDWFTAMLNEYGPTKDRHLFFTKNFITDSKFVGVPYDVMPKQFAELIDSLAVTVLDPNGGKVIITGSPQVGKSFLIDQLFYNREVFMDRANIDNLGFVRVTLEQAMLVDQNVAGRWIDYANLAMTINELRLDQIVFVTESLDAAIGLTSIGGRVVLEASRQTLRSLNQHENAGIVKQWHSWEIIDASEVYLDKFSLIGILVQAHLDSINLEYPEIHMTKKHVALLVDYSIKEGNLIIDSDMSEHHKGKIFVQPGIMAKMLFRFASTLAFDSAMRNSKGALLYTKAIKDTFRNFEGIIYKSFDDFMELMNSDDDDELSADHIRAMLENALPGVKIVQVQNAKAPNTEAPDQKVLKFSEISTLKERLSKKVLGQNEAITEIVNGLKISAAGLNYETKPLRSLLLLGPTGVGKTQLSLTLAEELMESPLPVKRIDMAEFGAAHEAAKLLGAPPGYVGHEVGGVLTNFIKANPQSIVILDEIEKAHPTIWDSFLQVLDAGRMTDGLGDTVDFSKSIVIMTSNLGADKIKKPNLGFTTGSQSDAYKLRVADAKNIVKKAIEDVFRPEMVNRIDQIVVFNELPQTVLREVIAKELAEASQKLTLRGYTLEKPKVDILDHIAGLSDVSKYGAREVQRVVGTNVLELLADEILTNTDRKTLTLAIGKKGLSVKSKESKANGALQAG